MTIQTQNFVPVTQPWIYLISLSLWMSTKTVTTTSQQKNHWHTTRAVHHQQKTSHQLSSLALLSFMAAHTATGTHRLFTGGDSTLLGCDISHTDDQWTCFGLLVWEGVKLNCRRQKHKRKLKFNEQIQACNQ